MASPVVDAEPDDNDLVARFRKGDTQAFSTLVIRYRKPLYNAAYRVTGNEADASDVAQAVFLRIVERLHDYDPRYKFFSWIYRIAVNEAIDMLRRTSREEPLDDDGDSRPSGFDGDPHGDPSFRYERDQASRRVQRALLELKVDDRVVITLRHFSECSYIEMGEILSLDEKTVKSRLFEARRRLAGKLSDLRVSA